MDLPGGGHGKSALDHSRIEQSTLESCIEPSQPVQVYTNLPLKSTAANTFWEKKPFLFRQISLF